MTSFVWQFSVSNEFGRSVIFFFVGRYSTFFSGPVSGLVLPNLCLSDQYITWKPVIRGWYLSDKSITCGLHSLRLQPPSSLQR